MGDATALISTSAALICGFAPATAIRSRRFGSVTARANRRDRAIRNRIYCAKFKPKYSAVP